MTYIKGDMHIILTLAKYYLSGTKVATHMEILPIHFHDLVEFLQEGSNLWHHRREVCTIFFPLPIIISQQHT